MTTANTNDIFDALNTAADPSVAAPFPRGLALDLVLEVGTLKEILDSYGLSAEQFQRILKNPAFRREYEAHKESMETEGWSFKKKAQAQAELYLNLVYRLATSDQTPAAVRADLIKSTVKWAGLDTPATPVVQQQEQLIPQLAEQLKNMPDGELEMRVLQIVMKKSSKDAVPASPAHTPGLLIEHES